MHFTSRTTSNNTPLSFDFAGKNVTRFGGLPVALDFLRKHNFFDSFVAVFDELAPRPKPHFQYDNSDLVTQITTSNIAGFSDFHDVDHLKEDPLFKHSVNSAGPASAPTLQRFFDKVQKTCEKQRREKLEGAGLKLEDLPSLSKTDPLLIAPEFMVRLNKALLGKSIEILEHRGDTENIIIDIDSTPVELHGNQQHRAYDAHYGINGYLPILITVNNHPAWVQIAPGAANGAALALLHIRTILQTVKTKFPDALVVVRADTGYNNNALIQAIVDENAKFIIGNNACGGKYQTEAVLKEFSETLATHPNIDSIPKQVLQALCPERFELTPAPIGLGDEERVKFRSSGLLKNYQPKSWTFARTIAYRLQYNSDFKKNGSELNFRFIQTNLNDDEIQRLSNGRGVEKQRSVPEASLETDPVAAHKSIELYEGIFCDRGNDERMNSEWKSSCYASLCSCSGFFANALRMFFSAVSMQAMQLIGCVSMREEDRPTPKKKRRSAKPNVTRAHKARKIFFGPTIRSIREFLIRVPATVTSRKRRIHISLAHMKAPFALAFQRLAQL